VAARIAGVGVDLCEVDRMRKVLERTPSFGTRVFTDAEREYCERRRHPEERYAARFAAKEAVMKAMGVGIGSCPMREIEVVSASSGAPAIVLHDTAAALAGERSITEWHLSMSHTASMAQAIAVAVC
jgi:phosphopantetheine--protein transferase-like protein